MKIRTITYSQTRQIKDFHPANYQISADITEDEDFESCCKELQRMTIRVLYKDQPVMRDSLIKQLVDIAEADSPKRDKAAPDTHSPLKSKKNNLPENDNFLKEKKGIDNEPPPDFLT